MTIIKLILACAIIGYCLDGFDGAMLGVGGLFAANMLLALVHDMVLLPLKIVKHRSGAFSNRRY